MRQGVGSALAVGAASTGTAVTVGSVIVVSVGWRPHPINATNISVILITVNVDFRLALISLLSGCYPSVLEEVRQ